MIRKCSLLLILALLAGSVAGQQNVVTFTRTDLAQLMMAACGPQGVPAKKVRIHRNEAGSMLYVVAEGQAESIIFAQTQTCNAISSETSDLWRNENTGAVIGQVAHRFDGNRLLIGVSGDGIRGEKFDIEPSGQYLVVSHGDVSSVSPVERPYIRTVELRMDAQRVFLRHGGLLVVGSNHENRQLEAIPVALQGGTAVAGTPIPLQMPAGVRVLDYNEKSDELLLGGLDASGATSFAVVNVSTGAAGTVSDAKPEAEFGLFVNDPALYARLTGRAGVQPASSGRPTPAAGQQEQRRGFNLFGLFGRKNN